MACQPPGAPSKPPAVERPAPAAPKPVPDPDPDKDGLPTGQDACPETPGLAAFMGCPVADLDGDCVADLVDVCPEAVGTAEMGGCASMPAVRWSMNQVELRDPVIFEVDKATLKPKSLVVLDALIAVLQDHPEWSKIEIQNHRAPHNREYYGRKITDDRAQSVRKYLISRGVSPDRLIARGYGDNVPLVPQDEPGANAINRRTEVHILARTDLPEGFDSKTLPRPEGCPDP